MGASSSRGGRWGYDPVPPPPPPDRPPLPSEITSGEKSKDGPTSYFFDSEQGIYFTYTAREIKQTFCRGFMQTLIVVGIFAAYFIAWNTYDLVIFTVAGASCLFGCGGIGWLLPSCGAGIFASLIHGVRLGAHFFHMDFKLTL